MRLTLSRQALSGQSSRSMPKNALMTGERFPARRTALTSNIMPGRGRLCVPLPGFDDCSLFDGLDQIKGYALSLGAQIPCAPVSGAGCKEKALPFG